MQDLFPESRCSKGDKKNKRGKMNKTEWITVGEAANEFNRTPKTIYRWIEEGFLQNVIKVRDGYFIPKEEIDRIRIIINPKK